ncbi:OsmC family protein [bacterium SCSIO 12741]|nr:OsmC family protein [bacterium SCSIO 12741]
MKPIEASLDSNEPNFKTHLYIDDHHLLADEPEEKGGGELGPTPFQYLAGSLASCTVITLKMYLNHKGWEYGAVTAKVSRPSDEKGPQNRFDVHVIIEGDFDDNQWGRLNRVAGRCPVHKVLEHGMEINLHLSPGLQS